MALEKSEIKRPRLVSFGGKTKNRRERRESKRREEKNEEEEKIKR